MHVWLAGRADLLRLFQRTLFRQADPVPGDAVRFLYTLLSTPPCERRYAWQGMKHRGVGKKDWSTWCRYPIIVAHWIHHTSSVL